MATTRYLSGGDKLEARLAEIAAKLGSGAEVEVGFMSDATYQDGTSVALNGTSVALVAALNEFGTSKAPPRPFFRNAIAANSDKWPVNVATALKANGYDPAKALDLVGQEIQEEIQDSIRSNTPPPNAPSTVARKGRDKTLIDTGFMLDSVTHRVTKL
jgi:hypothetical protein